jgi:hypothetical protein
MMMWFNSTGMAASSTVTIAELYRPTFESGRKEGLADHSTLLGRSEAASPQ